MKSQRLRRAFAQGAFLAVAAFILLFFAIVGQRNIEAQGIATGFAFLERSTGWPMSFSLVETSARSTYAWILFAGLLNTMLVGFLALFFATLLGLVLAFLRLSTNLLARLVGVTFVEVFRNVPLILQVVFWYAVLTHLPRPRDAVSIGEVVFLSNRGLMIPAPVLSGTDLALLAAAFAAFLAALWLVDREKRPPHMVLCGIGAMVGLFLVLWLSGRSPDAGLFTVPVPAGLRFEGGLALKPEFSALLIGMSLFGAAYVGEIVRGGLLSVDRGRLEAAKALGLSTWQSNRLIRVPLAIRAMLPALTNQYIWLMKATTLGIAIGFPDFFGIISTSINQSGQTLELIAILMIGFVIINYSMGFALNRVNDRLKLKGRS